MVIFGNYGSGKIVGKGIVQLGGEKAKSKDVLLVENMKHDLLSVSKMCDQGHILIFDSRKCEVRREKFGKWLLQHIQSPKIYTF